MEDECGTHYITPPGLGVRLVVAAQSTTASLHLHIASAYEAEFVFVSINRHRGGVVSLLGKARRRERGE